MKTTSVKILIGVMITALLFTGCLPQGHSQSLPTDESAPMEQAAASQQAAPAEEIRFTDALGREVKLEGTPKKAAAVMGSFAQVWLLAGGELAAVTRDVFQEGILPETAEVIDLGTMKAPSVETMLAQGIDFVILSAKLEEHVALREQLEQAGIPSAYFAVEVFEDYLDMLKICTQITGKPELYEENGTAVQAQIDAAKTMQEGKEPPTVLFIRAFSTGAKAKGSDNMTGAMLRDMGCINIADREGSLLEDLSMEVIIREDPDFIFVVTMGESSEKAIQSLEQSVMSNPAWSQLSAVKNGRYVVLPKELFHLKPNNRWGESYEMLGQLLYGDAQ
ncbi:ABC transporter substrate-binding protein [Oscillospiraceae bacterium MB08-C2-2]|nr:ABC transporter substrate-binding protein [Oscillospiraceae bacterium MB08-C2-2]